MAEKKRSSEAARRILVVDDELPIVDILREHFRGRYDVDTAANGAEALERIKAHEPDVVLLDIGMPGMDGLEVLRRIKEVSEAIPVIMLTANEDNAVAVEAVKSGAVSYIPKPVDLRYLDHIVAAVVESRSPQP